MAKGSCEHCGAEFTYNPANSKGKFCSYAHYWATGRPGTPMVDRLDSKIDRTGECWLWRGGKNNQGYGLLGGKLVHRLMYELNIGMIPPGMFVCHRCDTPLCCRPAHLFLGDGFANMQDAAAKRRTRNDKKTHCPQGHEYTPENTYTRGQRGRRCRKCQLARAQNRRLRASASVN